jgi:hypothetical protein
MRVLGAAVLLTALAAALGSLQRRFDDGDARRGIARALAHRPTAGGPTVLERLEALGGGAPRCGGELVSRALADVRVVCASPAHPETRYAFRVLVGGERPPRPESAAAIALVAGPRGRRRRASRPRADGHAPRRGGSPPPG